MATISDELATGLTKTLQLAQLDIQNQDKIFNGSGDVTLTRADGSTFAAATWAKMMAATVGTLKQNGSLKTQDLDAVNGSMEGFWQQESSANATLARHYPEAIAGALMVISDKANNINSCTQIYFIYNNNNMYIRNGTATSAGVVTWSGWDKVVYANNPTFTGKSTFAAATFTGEVIVPQKITFRAGAVILKSNSNNDFTFQVQALNGSAFDSVLVNWEGLYTNGRIDSTNGYVSRRGVGAASTGNKYQYGWESSGKMALYVDTSTIGFLQVESVSDRELKKSIKYRSKEDRQMALGEVMGWKTATFKFKARGDGLIPESDTKLGFIANDLKEVSPECVEGEGLVEGDELDPTKAFSLDTVAMMAKMTLAMQAMEDQITDLQNTVNELKAQLLSQ
ncbi:MAG: pyocin knob domain-containing S74 family peptidase [Enterobacteriaceae bacterium]|nr:pyocin knob domain-containing S74 family peptidase [Enterobacteriaceae bacterium]